MEKNKIFEDIETIRIRDPAAKSWFEIIFCYPGLHALWGHRVSHYLWNTKIGGLMWLARLISSLFRIFTGIEIHPGVKIGRRLFIDHGHGVVIGETSEIGDDCTIYQGVTLGGTSLKKDEKRHPTIGDGVIIGAGAKILGPFEIGSSAKIGSNAVVVQPVLPGNTVVGIPARVVKKDNTDKEKIHDDFQAYGVSGSLSDPIDERFQKLKEIIENQKKEIENLKTEIRSKSKSKSKSV